MFFTNPFKKEVKEPEKRLEDLIFSFNPLKVYCGDFIEVTTLDETATYSVSEIIEYSRSLGGDQFKHTDYRLEDNDKLLVLRVNPKKSLSLVTGSEDCDILVMKLIFEGEFEEDLQDAAKCKEFIKTNEDGSKIIYECLHAGKEGWNADLEIIKLNKGRTSRNVKYWDFFRESSINLNELFSGQVFLFVEIDQDDGFTTIWEGHIILNNEIKIYHKN